MIIAMSTTIFFPKTISYTRFDSKEECLAALTQAKKVWATIDTESKCVDLKAESEAVELRKKLKELEK